MNYKNINGEYKVKFYRDSKTNKSPALDYIKKLNIKERTKIFKYTEFLRQHGGYLEELYSKHIKDGIRELRVDFSHSRHRIFYFTFIGKKIIILHAFLKKTDKTPLQEIRKAAANYHDVLNNKNIYE